MLWLFLKNLLLFAVDDGCLENTPDTAEFSREFQLHQHLFDPEHDYPGLGKWVSPILIANKSYTLVLWRYWWQRWATWVGREKENCLEADFFQKSLVERDFNSKPHSLSRAQYTNPSEESGTWTSLIGCSPRGFYSGLLHSLCHNTS